jgi:CheY-like chemotaxis protein
MSVVKTILMIDDDLDDQEIFRQVVHEIDPSITCLQPLGSKLALDLLIEDSLMPDLIFVDINMPLMNGFEFLVEVKKFEPACSIPVIILTTSAAKEQKEFAKRLGAFSFITKPSDMKVLKDILERLIQQRQAMQAKPLL